MAGNGFRINFRGRTTVPLACLGGNLGNAVAILVTAGSPGVSGIAGLTTESV